MDKDLGNQPAEETARALGVDARSGLTPEEARSRLGQYGENRLRGKKGRTIAQMLLSQFKDFLIIILIIAGIVSIALGETLDGCIIFAIVVLNALLGTYQENKASNALNALKEMASPHAKVLRGGQVIEIPSPEVVPGDIVLLDAGDYVPADVRLIESVNLKIDESALTGESVSVEKDAQALVPEGAGLGDRVNSAYMSTIVTYGRGRGIVTGTGMDTEIGHIAGMLDEAGDEQTPLQKKLDKLGKQLGIICLVVCAVIFGLGLYHGMELLEIFMTAVSLAVAAIPEGLTVVVTVVLAMGMQRMVKSNAIIKRLSAVETLGSTTVICSDKTGTLTQNKMTVQRIYDGFREYAVSGSGYAPEGGIDGELSDSARRCVEGGALCNDSKYNPGEQSIIGDPTEGALVVLAHKAGMEQDALNARLPRVAEFPFDSDRKLMSSFHRDEDGLLMVTKGAPDEMLRRCTKIDENGAIRDLTEADRERILGQNQDYARQALRVIGVGYRELPADFPLENVFGSEEDIIFCGLSCMIDPPREEARQAIAVCRDAGIKVKMITGDHKVTASAIGAQLGIQSKGEAIEGREIEAMDEAALQRAVEETSIFARVSPEHKVRLVDALRKDGEIVAMTGDGVNDAPSLKRADIGVAMGITGTDVSKEAADMILTDDNFASIVKAVGEGRTIYGNIRKVVGYLLSCNIGEILLIFIAMLFNLPVPLVAIQLLSINLITDAFPAFALGMEKEEPGTMKRPPRDPKESIVDRSMALAVGVQSVFLAAGALLSYLYGLNFHGSLEAARTACFFTLVLGELLRAYSARSETISVLRMKPFENSYLNKCVLASLAFLFAAVYVPFLQAAMSTTALRIDELGVALLFAILPMLGGELAKVVHRRRVKA